MRHLKACTTLMFDVNTLIKVWHTWRPAPHSCLTSTLSLRYDPPQACTSLIFDVNTLVKVWHTWRSAPHSCLTSTLSLRYDTPEGLHLTHIWRQHSRQGMTHLKVCTSLMFDVNTLVKEWHTWRPAPHSCLTSTLSLRYDTPEGLHLTHVWRQHSH